MCRPLLILALLLPTVACHGDILNPGDDDDDDTADAAVDPTGDGGAIDAAAAGDGPAPGVDANESERMAVCSRWNSDRADLAEGTWTGAVAGCDPGDVTAPGRANALRLVNLYRWLADLPPVTNDATRDAKAQACALMMHANGALDHDPPASWTCYSADGAEGASRSNIATTSGVRAIDLYMVDPGNPTTIGHRRWILSNGLGPIGLGTTSSYSCLWVIGGSGGGGNPWTAWPPPGPFPLQAVAPSFQSIDETGWTIQSDAISLSGAQVTVTAGGADLPVTVTQLQGGFGSASAISFVPRGWTTEAGTVYHVEVTGIAEPISYDVDVVDCGG